MNGFIKKNVYKSKIKNKYNVKKGSISKEFLEKLQKIQENILNFKTVVTPT